MGQYVNGAITNLLSGIVLAFLTVVALAFLASIFVPALFK
jgi:hypothetical protein